VTDPETQNALLFGELTAELSSELTSVEGAKRSGLNQFVPSVPLFPLWLMLLKLVACVA